MEYGDRSVGSGGKGAPRRPAPIMGSPGASAPPEPPTGAGFGMQDGCCAGARANMAFLSDNAAPSWVRAAGGDEGYHLPYGDDDVMPALERRAAEIFGRPVRVLPVSSGSAANIVSVMAAARAPGVLVCHDQAHLALMENGAPARLSGLETVALPTLDGRLSSDAVEAAFRAHGGGGVLSLTQATELGTVYAPEALHELASVAHAHGAAVHVDGARLANALAGRGGVADDLRRAGVDVLSLGASKNGGRCGEAVVVLNEALACSAEAAWSMNGHRSAKTHILAGELLAYLDGDAWLRMAARANRAAARLGRLVEVRLELAPDLPVEANAVFVTLPEAWIEALRADGYLFNVWKWRDACCVRLTTSWCTTDDEIDGLVARLEAARSRTSRR